MRLLDVNKAMSVVSGSPNYRGTIDATVTSKTNAQATTPFLAVSPYMQGLCYLVQVTADVYILPVATSTSVVTTTTGVLLTAGERIIIVMEEGDKNPFLAAITGSSTSSVRVWELK